MNLQIRVGEGWDIHALVPGRHLILGGVTLAHPKGLLGHSDADALTHAVIDALLGAAGLGDIGRMFPDHDPSHQGADSMQLLNLAVARVRAAGWVVVNLDATVVAQEPRLASHLPEMAQRLALGLQVEPAQVNVKAKTAEKLGPVGQGQAIEARAVVLLQGVPRP
jgi:2-C-methyl-D-erythritol 2,4-cyclodiphosphate synthase